MAVLFPLAKPLDPRDRTRFVEDVAARLGAIRSRKVPGSLPSNMEAWTRVSAEPQAALRPMARLWGHG
jgi:hypothetical protein